MSRAIGEAARLLVFLATGLLLALLILLSVD